MCNLFSFSVQSISGNGVLYIFSFKVLYTFLPSPLLFLSFFSLLFYFFILSLFSLFSFLSFVDYFL
ncbi:hypothetical protein BD560DRAFT_238810 [Blakeslea trispora]|nr:hypothetical protein BD560DRAFT_238810 [Blakeslea trispora]